MHIWLNVRFCMASGSLAGNSRLESERLIKFRLPGGDGIVVFFVEECSLICVRGCFGVHHFRPRPASQNSCVQAREMVQVRVEIRVPRVAEYLLESLLVVTENRFVIEDQPEP